MTIKRPLLWAAGAMALGELASFVHPAVGLIVVIVYLIIGRGRARLILPVICLTGFLLAERAKAPLPEELYAASSETAFVQAEGKVCGISQKSDVYTVILKDCRVQARTGVFDVQKLQVRLKQPVSYGMRIVVRGELLLFEAPRNPGEFDYRMYYRSLGLRASMDAGTYELSEETASPLFQGIYELKTRAGEILLSICGEDDAGLLQAMILGDKGLLSPDTRKLYQDGGIAHLIAISGIHASLVGMTIYGIFRKLGVGFGASGLAAGGFLLCYGVMAGFGASVFRAVTMLLCHFLADALGRTYDVLSAMALAAILLLWDSPYLLLQSGFQLSFGAILAIAGAAKALNRGIPGEGRIKDGLVVGATVQLVTFPVILYHFFQFPPYGFFLNFLVIPAMTYLLFSGVSGILLGMVWPALGEFGVGTAHYILEFYRWLLYLTERFPGNLLVWGRPTSWELAVYYGALAVLLLLFYRGEGKCWRKSLAFLLIFVAGAVCLFYPGSPRRAQVTFLDVGQGDGAFIRTPQCTVLVDGGSSQLKNLGKNRLEPFLKSQAATVIDYAVVSHGDSDHINGLLYLLEECEEIRIQHLLLPDYDRKGEAYGPLADLAKLQGTDVHYMKAGDSLTSGKLRLNVLHPEPDFTERDINEQSLVFRLDYGTLSVLFTGDIEDGGEQYLLDGTPPELLHVDLLKAAHHGSKTSSGEQFLETVRPKAAILSYGEDNSYGHPSPEVVDRMKKLGIELWKTAQTGAVIVTEEEEGWRISSWLTNP